MFKNQSVFVNKDSATRQDLSQEKDYKIENIPIHTMEKDLQEIENPAMKKIFYPEKPIYQAPLPELNDRQKSSPFLNSSETSTTDNETRIRTKSNPDYAQINKAIQPKLDNTLQIKSSSGSKSFLISILLLITISVGLGAYYFITTRSTSTTKQTGTPSNTGNSANKQTGKTADNSVPLSAIKTSNPNYLSLDVANIDAISIKKALGKSAQDVVSSGLKTPIEFVLTNKQNNPISFSDFAKMADITLSEKTLSYLDKDFSLFFFNDNGNPGLGLRLKTSNPAMLKDQLSQEENLLSAELAPLLPIGSNPSATTSPFQDAQYKNYNIRYQNIVSPQKLSIDYTIQGNSFILATTKLTMETILDKLSPQ